MSLHSHSAAAVCITISTHMYLNIHVGRASIIKIELTPNTFDALCSISICTSNQQLLPHYYFFSLTPSSLNRLCPSFVTFKVQTAAANVTEYDRIKVNSLIISSATPYSVSLISEHAAPTSVQNPHQWKPLLTCRIIKQFTCVFLLLAVTGFFPSHFPSVAGARLEKIHQ